MDGNGMKSITDLEKKIVNIKRRYSKFLEERERMRKREHDVHFSHKDQQILVKSFVIAGVIENGLRRILVNIL